MVGIMKSAIWGGALAAMSAAIAPAVPASADVCDVSIQNRTIVPYSFFSSGVSLYSDPNLQHFACNTEPFGCIILPHAIFYWHMGRGGQLQVNGPGLPGSRPGTSGMGPAHVWNFSLVSFAYCYIFHNGRTGNILLNEPNYGSIIIVP